jgi:RNA polymerase sigma factor for flagellar operon FliA
MPHRAHARYAAESGGDAALLARHAALVDRVARRVASRTAGAVAPEDLWSSGAMGLLEAARRFDAARDVRFESFAEHRIRGAMLDEMRRMDHLPRRLRSQADDVQRARGRLGQALQREPTAEEVSAELGVALEDLAALDAVLQPHLTDVDALAGDADPADEQVARREQREALAAAIATLPDRLQLVLSLHYAEGLTYREVAKILDVSEPRVCQLHAEAMAQLRGVLDEGS